MRDFIPLFFGNALSINIYEKTIVVQFINIEEHYLTTNPENLAIRQRIKIEAIAELPHIWPTRSEINSQTGTGWLRQKQEKNQIVKDSLENLFHWRRSL